MEGAVNILVATSPVTRGISLPQVYQRERECVIVCVGERESFSVMYLSFKEGRGGI